MSKASNVKRGADSQQRLVRLVLAGNHRQAERYARENGWQPRDWRYLAGEAYARGFRDVELHKVGTWYERADAAEIFRVLEPIKHIGTLIVIEPNNQAHRSADEKGTK